MKADDVFSVIEKNKDKDFVRRIYQSDAPYLDNGDGSISTHLMAWGERGGKYFVYPEIANVHGKLKRLSPDRALDYAIDSGEYVKFDTPEEAEQFSTHYKEYRPEPGKMPLAQGRNRDSLMSLMQIIGRGR